MNDKLSCSGFLPVTGGRFLILIILALLVFAEQSHSTVLEPEFSPARPQSGKPFQIITTSSGCDGFPTTPVDEPVVVGNEIILRGGYARIEVGPCIFESSSFVWNVGPLSPGNYEVVLIGADEITLMDVEILRASIGVFAARIPTLGFWSICLLVVFTMLFGFKNLGARANSTVLTLSGAVIFAVLFMQPESVTAQETERSFRTIAVLLSPSEDAPTAEQVVERFDSGREDQLLQGLNVGDPVSVDFLIPIRAEGDFARLVEEYPDAPASVLQRYILVEYPDNGIELDVPERAFRKDPFVDYANRATSEVRFSSARPKRPTEKGLQQPNLDDMSLPDAHLFSTGHGISMIIDSGLDVDHPDLLGFDGSGIYQGGGFLPVGSLDVGAGGTVDEAEPVVAGAGDTVCDEQDDQNMQTDGFMVPDIGGHGTHVAAILGGDADNDGVDGACPKCGIW